MKIQVMQIDLYDNKAVVVIDGETQYIRLDRITQGCIIDNVESCIHERKYTDFWGGGKNDR
jgi:hypothetical protein